MTPKQINLKELIAELEKLCLNKDNEEKLVKLEGCDCWQDAAGVEDQGNCILIINTSQAST